MRPLAIVRVFAAVALIATAVAIAQWGGLRGAPQQVLKTLFDQAQGLPRQALVGLCIATPITLLLTLSRLARRRRAAPAQVLSLFSALAPLVGVAAALFDLAMLFQGGSFSPSLHPASVGPGLAEAALIAGLGVLVGAIAALPKGASWNGGA